MDRVSFSFVWISHQFENVLKPSGLKKAALTSFHQRQKLFLTQFLMRILQTKILLQIARLN